LEPKDLALKKVRRGGDLFAAKADGIFVGTLSTRFYVGFANCHPNDTKCRQNVKVPSLERLAAAGNMKA
jgi:hypothetical protein